MRKQYNKRPEIVFVGDYTPNIPFHIEYFVTEHLLDTPDQLAPEVDSEGKSPRVGATSLYRLIGDGSTEPVFSSTLIKSSTSANYDVTQGIVNLIEFFYDGDTFWYTIINGLATSDSPIQDKGEGPTTLSITTRPASTAVQLVDGTPLARITVKELLVSVGYEGTEEITYGIGKDYIITEFNTDPLLAYVDYECAELGTQVVSVSVSTPSITCPPAITFVLIFDNNGVCSH